MMKHVILGTLLVLGAMTVVPAEAGAESLPCDVSGSAPDLVVACRTDDPVRACVTVTTGGAQAHCIP